ncbi:MAG: UDP-glucose/GDP-mannose dehydrogenase family protein [Bdellovibrionales bacterium]|nr:UDP-glucose/GDP-mannose dehydrogenase family protein [Bdellovibrionales bacterium]
MKVAVIGTGYVGLVAGACFADAGNSVACVDRDHKKIDTLRMGKVPFYEPGLEELVRRGVAEGRLSFTPDTAAAVRDAEVVFLAVGTPSGPDGAPDLTALKAASVEVGQAMNGYKLIVNKSTVPIGMHAQVAGWMREHARHEFDVVSNPEFLKEGAAVQDFLKPDRVVIGTDKDQAFRKMKDLYAPFVRQGNPILRMDPVSAEITKYACNAFLAARISFMNELSLLCERVGADVETVRMGMSTDLRIGKHFLYAGVGYGGSCFPKDIEALLHTARSLEVPMEIVQSVQRANLRQRKHFVERVFAALGSDLLGKTLAVWGLAFKPNTDDMREAPSVDILRDLHAAGARIQAFDPAAGATAAATLGGVVALIAARRDEVLEGADALLILTEWNDFRHPDWELIRRKLKRPLVFDGRNVYSPTEMRERGFEYHSVGRPSV